MSSRAAPAWTKNCSGQCAGYPLPTSQKSVGNSRPSPTMCWFFHCETRHIPHWAFALLIILPINKAKWFLAKSLQESLEMPYSGLNVKIICSFIPWCLSWSLPCDTHWVCPQRAPIAPALSQCLHHLGAGLLACIQIKCWLSLFPS